MSKGVVSAVSAAAEISKWPLATSKNGGPKEMTGNQSLTKYWIGSNGREEEKEKRHEDQFSDPSCDDSEDAASVPVLVQSPRPGGKERDGMRNDLKLPSLKCQVSGWLTRCFQNWQPPTILPSTAVYL